MKKSHLGLVILVMMALMVLAVLPVLAGPPTEASGLWQYTPHIDDMRTAGCNTFLTTHEEGVWTGTFVGNSVEQGQVGIYCNGRWSFNADVIFDEVTVGGRTGALRMSVVGSRPDGTADWFGYWVIIEGTEGLANLRGQGQWWGPGAPAEGVQGDIWYDGKVHFEPN